MGKICYNGYFTDAAQPILQAADRGYRYGDGFFETIKVTKGIISLIHYHKKRMEHTIALLDYKLPAHTSINILFEKILELCERNNCIDAARVRLSFSNGNGGLYDENQTLHYIIEAWPLNDLNNSLNTDGLLTGIFTGMKKSCDNYAHLKTSSALIYSIAARTASNNKWNDCLILNPKDHICESSIANIFWIKNKIYTPPSTEGCVSGVMRAYMIDSLKTVTEKHVHKKMYRKLMVFLQML